MRRIDLTGKKFGKLTVLNVATKKAGDKLLWECLCACGNIYNVIGSNLSSRKSRRGSVMCRRCFLKILKTGIIPRTHGMRSTRFYGIWHAMRQRCNNPNYTYTNNYGGRGITVCKRWNDSFINFKKDMYKDYLKHVATFGEKNTSIERKNNDDGYSFENCIWATRAIQRRNTRKNHFITFRGETKVIEDWAKRFGFKKGDTIGRRIKRGWSVADALLIPVKSYK